MLNRYFIHLGYKGTQFHGWQIQPNSITVQEIVNKSLSLLIGENIETIGAGRTDTGVHAFSFYAHFDCIQDNIHINPTFVYKLNCIFPKDIVAHQIYLMHPSAHARFDAISRTYLYRINQFKDPFNQDLSMHFIKPLNIELLNDASTLLKEYTDFTSFSKLHTDVKTNNCHIYQAIWNKVGYELHFTICADRFLRNMVRAIVGTLIQVGLGKISLQNFRSIIELKNRSNAGASVDPKGLHLINIEYSKSYFHNLEG